MRQEMLVCSKNEKPICSTKKLFLFWNGNLKPENVSAVTNWSFSGKTIGLTQKVGFLFTRGLSHYLEESFCERYVSFIPHCKIHILRPKSIMENNCHINLYSSYFENAFGLAKNAHNQIIGAKKASTSFWYKKEPCTWYKSANDSIWKCFLWLV